MYVNNEKKTITFKADEKILKMFELAVSLSNIDPDQAFADWVQQLSYDSLKQSAGNASKLQAAQEESKKNASASIKAWAKKKEGICYNIIKSYFKMYDFKKDHVVTKDSMEKIFERLMDNPGGTLSRFTLNFRLMCSDADKAYGLIFKYDKITKEVTLHESVKPLLMQMKDEFLK